MSYDTPPRATLVTTFCGALRPPQLEAKEPGALNVPGEACLGLLRVAVPLLGTRVLVMTRDRRGWQRFIQIPLLRHLL
jgi:hypothetical protein